MRLSTPAVGGTAAASVSVKGAQDCPAVRPCPGDPSPDELAARVAGAKRELVQAKAWEGPMRDALVEAAAVRLAEAQSLLTASKPVQQQLRSCQDRIDAQLKAANSTEASLREARLRVLQLEAQQQQDRVDLAALRSEHAKLLQESGTVSQGEPQCLAQGISELLSKFSTPEDQHPLAAALRAALGAAHSCAQEPQEPQIPAGQEAGAPPSEVPSRGASKRARDASPALSSMSLNSPRGSAGGNTCAPFAQACVNLIAQARDTGLESQAAAIQLAVQGLVAPGAPTS